MYGSSHQLNLLGLRPAVRSAELLSSLSDLVQGRLQAESALHPRTESDYSTANGNLGEKEPLIILCANTSYE